MRLTWRSNRVGAEAGLDPRTQVQAVRQTRLARRFDEFRGIQGYWSRQGRDKSILAEEDLERYLGE